MVLTQSVFYPLYIQSLKVVFPDFQYYLLVFESIEQSEKSKMQMKIVKPF
jgi:hypothetical protein